MHKTCLSYENTNVGTRIYKVKVYTKKGQANRSVPYKRVVIFVLLFFIHQKQTKQLLYSFIQHFSPLTQGTADGRSQG